MFEGKKIWAIIPARKGSKRIPGKNLKPLCGEPLINWTLKAAKNSNYLDRIFVSTDCEEISSYSKSQNIEVPNLRPFELAQDESKTTDVLVNFFDQFKTWECPDIFILLQPTSPLRDSNHIDEAIKFYFKKKADAVISISECPPSTIWANSVEPDLNLENFFQRELLIRSQELPKKYSPNGAIYICNLNAFLKEKDFFLKKNIFGFLMDENASVDIDTEKDFYVAEFLLKKPFESLKY